jgi:gamma-D-glutamyl-L-lysine dipeptidyl-peptidase
MKPILLPIVLATLAPFVSRTQGQTTRPTTSEIRDGIDMSGTFEQRSKIFFDNLAKRAEPSGHGDINRLPAYLAFFRREIAHDIKTTAFSASAEVRDGHVTVTGFSEFAELSNSLTRFLRALGFVDAESKLELLPSPSLGNNAYGLVRVPRSFIYSAPDLPRETLSEATMGEPVFLLKAIDNQYLCHGSDGYVGYIAASDVRPVNADALRQYQSGWTATILRDSGIDGEFLAAGSRLHASKNRSDVVVLQTPDGKAISIPADRVAMHADASPVMEKIIAAAREVMGTPYVWGGKTSFGIDCSGLIQTAFATEGIRLPRDADQQALCGVLTATRTYRGGLRRGDLLFFIAGRGGVHHVAIYLGDNQYLQAIEKGVSVASFNPSDKNYDEKHDKSFGFAKRIVD